MEENTDHYGKYLVASDHSRANYVDVDGSKYYVPKSCIKFNPKRHLDGEGNELVDVQGRPLLVLDRGICTNTSIGGEKAATAFKKKLKAKAMKDDLSRENRGRSNANLDTQAGKRGFGRA